jgi:hypothetical protein
MYWAQQSRCPFLRDDVRQTPVSEMDNVQMFVISIKVNSLPGLRIFHLKPTKYFIKVYPLTLIKHSQNRLNLNYIFRSQHIHKPSQHVSVEFNHF